MSDKGRDMQRFSHPEPLPRDVVVRTCAVCLGVFIDTIEGRGAHVTVFGHNAVAS